MTHLDPRGLEAAIEAVTLLQSIRKGEASSKECAVEAVAAYLAAAQAEGEVDRIAVVCNAEGEAAGYTVRTDKPWWGTIEDALSKAHNMQGPFARQIVRVRLRRPEPPAEVVGRVEP